MEINLLTKLTNMKYYEVLQMDDVDATKLIGYHKADAKFMDRYNEILEQKNKRK